MKIDVVFFDLGNVVVNVHLEKFYSDLSNASGLSVKKVVRLSDTLKSLSEQFNRGKVTASEFIDTASKTFPSVSKDVLKKCYVGFFSENLSVTKLLPALSVQTTVSLISNTDELHYNYICDNFSIMELFQKPLTSFDAQSMKPEKEIYLKALDNLGANPENTLFIDDLSENIKGALEIGFNTIHYTPDIELEKELKIYGFQF